MTARGRQRDIGAGDDDNVDNNRMQDGDDDENCLLVTHRKEPLAITRIIHQQYRTASESEWPPEWRSLSKLWQTHHPSWRWQFWTDADEAKLFQEHLPEFFELYQSIASCLQAPISKADLSTYAILYVHGGVYADMDTGAVWAVDELLTSAVRATGRHVALIVNIERPDDGSLEVRGSGGVRWKGSVKQVSFS
ncbi:SUR1 [Symbiodinium sp. KB8]|nr:SUR1 [Symbiodinium sp. KB8]